VKLGPVPRVAKGADFRSEFLDTVAHAEMLSPETGKPATKPTNFFQATCRGVTFERHRPRMAHFSAGRGGGSTSQMARRAKRAGFLLGERYNSERREQGKGGLSKGLRAAAQVCRAA
jgi:hypothetical protein